MRRCRVRLLRIALVALAVSAVVGVLLVALASVASQPHYRAPVAPQRPTETAIPTYGPLAPLPIPVTLDPKG
jgi:hypothetical protein